MRYIAKTMSKSVHQRPQTTRLRTALLDELLQTMREARSLVEPLAKARPAADANLWRLDVGISQAELQLTKALHRSLRAAEKRQQAR